MIDGKEGLVIGIQGEGDQAIVTVDMNPPYTWKDIEYKVKVLQVGGKELQTTETSPQK